jgi:Fe-S-cluster-containing dehydrogenase component
MLDLDEQRVTRHAMLIDLNTCIGWHACSVACKSEFDVPSSGTPSSSWRRGPSPT